MAQKGLIAAILAAILLAPTALAHLDRERPHVQASEARRDVTLTSTGTAALIDMLFTLDANRDSIRHVVDPTKGIYDSQYRRDPSDVSTAFSARWSWVQMVEFRDANADGQFQPGTDPVVRSWKPANYAWNVSPPRKASISGQTAEDMAWNGTLASGPRMDLEMATLGVSVKDEGARIRPQDYALYLDIRGFPPREVGDLFAIEWAVAPPSGAKVVFDETSVDNRTVVAGARVEAPQRLAFLDWGAQATLDGVEEFVNATMSAPDERGNRSLFMHFPRFDSSLHMVFVVGIEYETPVRRGTAGFEAVPLLAATVVLAILSRRR